MFEDSELRMLAAVESPIAVLCQDKTLLFANQQFTDLSGQGGSVVGESLEGLIRDSSGLAEAIELSRSVSGSIPCRMEFRDNGKAFLCSLTCLEKGTDARYLIQGKQRRMDHFVHLNKQLHELDGALEKADATTRKYKAINDGIEQFLQKLVHDIRSPISSILSGMSMAKDDLKEANYESLASLLDMSDSSAKRLLNFVDRLYGDLKEVRPKLNLEEVALDSLVEELRDDLDTAIKEAGARVEFKGEPFRLQADRLLLRQLLQNLIQNSIKFRSKERPLVILINVDCGPDNRTSIRVQDNGRGFELNQAEGLFERFYRLNPSEGDGLGLGLTTCRQIAELHGWNISATGQPGEGAIFKLLIN